MTWFLIYLISIIVCACIDIPHFVKNDVEDIGIEEYFTKKGITIIEWADMIPDYLPEKRLDIKIKSSEEDEDKRIITITPYGRKYEELCEAIL